MKRRIALALIWFIDVLIVLLGGWKLVPMKINGRTVWEWERDYDGKVYDFHYRRPLAEASRTQEAIWRNEK